MGAADQLLWVFVTCALGVCAWALAKIFDRTVADITSVRAHVQKIAERVQQHELDITILKQQQADD